MICPHRHYVTRAGGLECGECGAPLAAVGAAPGGMDLDLVEVMAKVIHYYIPQDGGDWRNADQVYQARCRQAAQEIISRLRSLPVSSPAPKLQTLHRVRVSYEGVHHAEVMIDSVELKAVGEEAGVFLAGRMEELFFTALKQARKWREGGGESPAPDLLREAVEKLLTGVKQELNKMDFSYAGETFRDPKLIGKLEALEQVLALLAPARTGGKA